MVVIVVIIVNFVIVVIVVCVDHNYLSFQTFLPVYIDHTGTQYTCEASILTL
jgi:hypothetical protein